MPSIKSCFLAFALVAAAIAPIAAATPVKVDASSLTRRTSNPSHYSNDAAVEKRASAESRKEAAARIKRSKIKAAKKAKRQSTEREASTLMKRAVADIHAAEGVTKRDLEARAVFARALRRIRCGVNNRVCRQAVTSPSDLPANGAAICSPSTHQCVVGCRTGYVLSDGACVASSPTCGANTCGTVQNGVYLCSGDNQCTLACDTAAGYTASAQGTCINTITDADNCGSVGNVCPGSYNGIGVRSCKSGLCKVVCPAGYGLRRTQDRSQTYCYGTGRVSA
ncbi:hypothetical protein JCM11641_000315 [Rhodosporidiobolus odoratus]